MSGTPTIYEFKTLREVTSRIRDDLKADNVKASDFVLLFAYNGTGKTRLSVDFKDAGKKKNANKRDTLYFNAFTEDLFSWDNDLDNDKERVLKINSSSRFFDGLEKMEMESRIRPFLHRYADFDFLIDYEKWTINFSREVQIKTYSDTGTEAIETKTVEHIKISRGEENIFIWCFFLSIVQLALDKDTETYQWVKYIYIDDPISSLDDNNAIAVASDLAGLLKDKDKDGKRKGREMKFVISSHHALFFNVMYNELHTERSKTYFYNQNKNLNGYTLRHTKDTPFFHHVAILDELKKAVESDNIYTYHFNMMRSIMEKTATFFGYDKGFKSCLHGIEDEMLYERALQLLSHGNYSIYEPKEMVDDTKQLFRNIFNGFLDRYRFELPQITNQKEIEQ